MPTEPKPVGQVSRFSLLIPGGCDSNQDDLSDGATVNDSGNSDCDEPIQKDDWLPRETKNSKKKKKERKRSEKNLSKSDNSEKQQQQQQLPTKSMKTEKVCQKETSKQPTSNTTPKLQTQPHNSESNSTTQTNSKKSKKTNSIPPKIIPPAHNSLSAEEDVKTPTGSSSLDQDFLKTSQNLDLEEFRKSLEQINNSGFENGISSNFLRNGSISSLGQSDDSICDSLKTSTLDGVTDLSLYSIQGTISNLQGKLIQGLKGIESKIDASGDKLDDNNNDYLSEINSKNDEISKLKDQVDSLNMENLMLKNKLQKFENCQSCNKRIELRAALSCGHSYCSICTNEFWRRLECPICKQRPAGFSFIALDFDFCS